jgi:hypothetical protein
MGEVLLQSLKRFRAQGILAGWAGFEDGSPSGSGSGVGVGGCCGTLIGCVK